VLDHIAVGEITKAAACPVMAAFIYL